MDQQNNSTGSAGLMNKVKDGAVTQLNTQKERATEGIGSVAKAVRQTTQPLRDAQQETMAHYAEQAAGQLDRLSTALREKDVSELLGDAQRFARRNPAIFIGSAFAIGLMAARFFKSKGSPAYQGGPDWRRAEFSGTTAGAGTPGSAYGSGYGRGLRPSPVGTSGVGTPGSGSAAGAWGNETGQS